MGHPRGAEAHTLAQFARRAGISEGRARALHAAEPVGLPQPDRTDAGGRPLWFAGTIDAWCARTGRTVPADSLWIFRQGEASSPAVELQRGLVELGPHGYRRTMFAIVWDTEHGHLIYLQPVGETGGDHKDWMAAAAAELIEPRWWSSAVVVMPVEEELAYSLPLEPIGYIYRLIADPESESSREGVRRWFRRAASARAGRAEARAEWVSHLPLAEIAAAIGHRIPLWLSDTTTVDNARAALAYGDRTFTIPDTLTAWPAAEHRVQQAERIGLAHDYPAAFAALVTDAAQGLTVVRESHENTPNTGPGWHLVCRPAKPAPPVEIEQLLSTTQPVEDLELVAKDLTELRPLERDLSIDDPRGEVYEYAIERLAQQLRRAERTVARPAGGGGYTALADDQLTAYRAPWTGPVVDTWHRQLTSIDLREALQLRRVQQLVADRHEHHVQRCYRDLDGRYVLIIQLDSGSIWCLAEWPTGLGVVEGWTDETVLAADDSGSAVTLLALTPDGDGLRADPVPLLPDCFRDAFSYGYGGGTPASTYAAILRAAFGEDEGRVGTTRVADLRCPDGELRSQLWDAISTTKGPLRLSWPQVQLWARADRRLAHEQNPGISS